MLMPTVSVTLIGIAVAIVGIAQGRPSGATLRHSLVGAWLGFVVGALPGLVLDIILTDGVFLPLLGHVAALAGAAIAVREPRSSPSE